MSRFWKVLSILALLGTSTLATAQTPANLEFEVIAIHPSAGDHIDGPPVRFDPGRVRLANMSLSALIYFAYDLLPYKVDGPDWLQTEKFDIDAVPPAGSKPEQYRAMLRAMLADRFQLHMHYEKRLVEGYELSVAKGGPKFGNFDSQPRFLMKNDPHKNSWYFTDLPIGQAGSSGNAGKARVAGKEITLGALALVLRGFVRMDVEDHTGLAGKYTMNMYFDPDHPETRREGGESLDATVVPNGYPLLPAALRDQLGLELKAAHVSADVTVIDHISRQSTAN